MTPKRKENRTMAVNFDYKGKQAALFQAKPDVQMNIQFEDGEHVWI